MATAVPATVPEVISDETEFRAHISSVDKPPTPLEDVELEPPAQRQTLLSLWIVYYTLLINISGRCAGAATTAGQRFGTFYTAQLQHVTSLLTGTPAAAAGTTTGSTHKPKVPKLTPCDIFGQYVDVYLKSVALHLKNYPSMTNDQEIAMVYVNNLTEASKAHLYNIHPLTDTAFYSSSARVIEFLRQYTYETDKMTHALSVLRGLTMKGLKLKAYYQQFTKHLAACEWPPNSREAIRFFVEGLNPDALPTNLKLVVQDKADAPGINVMQLYTFADRKLALVHGEKYENISITKTNVNHVNVGLANANAGPSNRGKRRQEAGPSNVRVNYNKKLKANNKGKQPVEGRVEYETCDRCGKKHLGSCWAKYHKDGTQLEDPAPAANPKKITVDRKGNTPNTPPQRPKYNGQSANNNGKKKSTNVNALMTQLTMTSVPSLDTILEEPAAVNGNGKAEDESTSDTSMQTADEGVSDSEEASPSSSSLTALQQMGKDAANVEKKSFLDAAAQKSPNKKKGTVNKK